MVSDAKDPAHYFLIRLLDLRRAPVEGLIQGQDGMQPHELRELADITTRLLSIISESSWWSGEVLEIWKKANDTPIFKEDNFTLIPGKAIVQIILAAISNPMKDKKVTGISQHGVMKGESCLNNLRALCDEMTGFVDEERVVDVPGPLAHS